MGAAHGDLILEVIRCSFLKFCFLMEEMYRASAKSPFRVCANVTFASSQGEWDRLKKSFFMRVAVEKLFTPWDPPVVRMTELHP